MWFICKTLKYIETIQVSYKRIGIVLLDLIMWNLDLKVSYSKIIYLHKMQWLNNHFGNWIAVVFLVCYNGKSD